jgi:hypothetical protein
VTASYQEEARVLRELVEQLLLQSERVPRLAQRTWLTDRAVRTIEALDAFLATQGDESVEALDRVDTAIVDLDQTLGVVQADGAFDRAATSIRASRRALWEERERMLDDIAARSRALVASEEPAQFAVSRGVPAIFTVPVSSTAFVRRSRGTLEADVGWARSLSAHRGELLARRLLEASDEDERGLVTLRRPSPRRAEPATDGRSGELAHLARIARDAAEQIGVLGNLRQCEGLEAFGEWVADFEGRLLADLDALMAMGWGEPSISVAEELAAYCQDAFTDDDFRAFCRAFVLGCIRGEAASRTNMLALRQSSPATHAAQTVALALASSADLDEALAELSRESSAKLVRVAVEAMLARRRAVSWVIAPLVRHSDLEVVGNALRCLALTEDEAAAAQIVEEMLGCEPDEELIVPLCEVGLIRSRKASLARLRNALDQELAAPGSLARPTGDALWRLLGLAGEAQDVDRIRRALDRPAAIEAAGWLGATDLVADLIGRLESDSLRPFAVRALQRITGALDDEDGPLAATVWRAWYERERPASGAKLRFGRPRSAIEAIDELLRDGVLVRDREMAAYELALAGHRWMWVHDWYARQRAVLTALRAELDSAR